VSNNVLGFGDAGIDDVGIFGRVASSGRAAKVDTVPYCVTISVSPLRPGDFPKTVMLDFGSGCRSHGHLRSGKITTVYTGRLSETGSSATTTFENFRFDSISVEGTHKSSNTRAAGSNQRQFTVQITNAKLTASNGNYTERSASRVHTQIEGNATLSPADDIFRLTGSSSGKTKNGGRLFSWSTAITEPLIRPRSCRWVTQGILAITRSGAASNSPWSGILNFGNGTCNNAAILTINGTTRQIVLR
jgi:hypothetical protein